MQKSLEEGKWKENVAIIVLKCQKVTEALNTKIKKNPSCIDDSSILLQFKNENYFSLFAQ